MTFKPDIQLFHDFLSLYGEQIDEMPEIKDVNLYIITPGSGLAGAIFAGNSNEYFLSNKINGGAIGYNAENCDRICLTTAERYAMIAHELGHLFLVPKEETNFLKKELKADEMACRLGLGNDLCTGLQKIINDDPERDTVEQMKERISLLSSKC